MHKSNTAEAVYLFSILGISYVVLGGISGFARNSGSAAGINSLVCTVVCFLVLRLCAIGMGEKDFFNLTDSVYGRKMRFVIMTLFFAVTILNASARLEIYTDAVSELILRKTPKEVIAAVFCICAFFACRFGTKSLSRYSLVIFILFCVLFAVILCFSATEIKKENMFPLLGRGDAKNVANMLYLFSDAVYVTLAFRGRGAARSMSVIPVVTGIAGMILTAFYTLCVPYYALDYNIYPLYTLASLANSSVIFQRLDGLVFIIWFFCGFVSVGALALFATEIFKKNFSLSDRRAVSAPVVLLIFLVWSSAFIDKKAVFNAMTVITFAFLPLTVILHRLKLKKTIIPLVLSLCIVCLSGCYDNKETDTFATVLSVAVDKSPEGRKYTFSVADTSGKTGTDGGDSASSVTLSVSAENIHNAVNTLSGRLSRNLSLSHLSAVLFSLEEAQKGMYEEIEYLEKRVSVRPQTHIVVTKGNAGEFLSQNKPKLQPNSEKYFDGILNKGDIYLPSMRISDFLTAYRGKKSHFVPVIAFGDESGDGIEDIVCGVVKNGKLEGTSDKLWLPALISGKGSCIFEGKLIKTDGKTDIRVSLDNGLRAEIILSVNDDRITLDKLEKSMERELTEYASRGYDVADIWGRAAGLFRLQKNYELQDSESLIKNAIFDVKTVG